MKDAFWADQENWRGERLGRKRRVRVCGGKTAARAPVGCNFVIPKRIVPFLNDCNAAVVGDGHAGAAGRGVA